MKNESLLNGAISYSILNVNLFMVNDLSCELSSDRSIIDMKNMRSVICGID